MCGPLAVRPPLLPPVNPARLLSKYYGESNKFAEAYFSLAHKLSPAILFIDEIDCMFRTRNGTGHEHEARAATPPLAATRPVALRLTRSLRALPPFRAVCRWRRCCAVFSWQATSMLKAQFLSLWDGLLSPSSPTVVVIAATNRPADVDPAVLRRLPLSFQIDLPAADGRKDVLRLLLRDEPLAQSVDLDELAAATDGYSGSDLDQLCRTAAMRALEDSLDAAMAAEAEAEAALAAGEKAGAGEGGGSSGSDSIDGGGGSGCSGESGTRGDGRGEVEGGGDGGVAEAALATAAGVDAAPAPTPPTTEAAEVAAVTVEGGSASGGGLALRPLTLDDFLSARAVVRPTRGRFAGVHHEVHDAAGSLHPHNHVESAFDEELYN